MNTPDVQTQIKIDWRSVTEKVNSMLNKAYHFSYVRNVGNGHHQNSLISKALTELGYADHLPINGKSKAA